MSTVTSTGTIRLLSLAAVLALSAVAAGQQRQVTGTVVDADGAPVAGADVASYWSFGEKPQASNGGTSDDDGSFTVDVRFGGRPTALMAMNAERTAGNGDGGADHRGLARNVLRRGRVVLQ